MAHNFNCNYPKSEGFHPNKQTNRKKEKRKKERKEGT